jgi:hypothetical protein
MFDRDLDLRAPTQETGFFNGGKRLLRSIFVKKTRFLLESGRFSITITFFSRSLFIVKSRLVDTPRLSATRIARLQRHTLKLSILATILKPNTRPIEPSIEPNLDNPRGLCLPKRLRITSDVPVCPTVHLIFIF